MLVTTARDLIARSHRVIGVLARNARMSGLQGSQGLQVLKEVIDLAGANPGLSFMKATVRYTLIPGERSFALSSPSASISVWTNTNGSVRMLTQLPFDQLSALQDDETSNSGEAEYFAFSNGQVFIYPTVAAEVHVAIASASTDVNAIDLDTLISGPQGWVPYLTYQTAIQLCSEYGVDPVPATVARLADSSRRAIESNVLSQEVPPLQYDDIPGVMSSGSGRRMLIGRTQGVDQ